MNRKLMRRSFLRSTSGLMAMTTFPMLNGCFSEAGDETNVVRTEEVAEEVEEPQVLANVVSIEESVEEPKVLTNDDILDSLVMDLSQYRVVHFGECHRESNSAGRETTTTEDFVEYFLPRFRDRKLVGDNMFTNVRTEYFLHERDKNGEITISDEELARFDRDGSINASETPNFAKVILMKDPIGGMLIARKGVQLGYKVRGCFPPVDEIEEIMELGSSPEDQVGLSNMVVIAMNEHYKRAIGSDLEDSQSRVLVYGGALHNDTSSFSYLEYGYKDPLMLGDGVGTFTPGYVAVDLVKFPFVESPSYLEFTRNILREEGHDPDNFNQIVVARRYNTAAGYFVFLPERFSEGD